MSTDRHTGSWRVETTIERGDTPFGRILTAAEFIEKALRSCESAHQPHIAAKESEPA